MPGSKGRTLCRLPPVKSLARAVKTHARNATLVKGQNGILNPIDERDSFIGTAVKLSGAGADGIEQTITGLLPNTRYVFAGWVKVDDAPEVEIGVRTGDGGDLHQAAQSRKWQMPKVEFVTGANNTSVTVYMLKTGSGVAYGDEFGLIPAY